MSSRSRSRSSSSDQQAPPNSRSDSVFSDARATFTLATRLFEDYRRYSRATNGAERAAAALDAFVQLGTGYRTFHEAGEEKSSHEVQSDFKKYLASRTSDGNVIEDLLNRIFDTRKSRSRSPSPSREEKGRGRSTSASPPARRQLRKHRRPDQTPHPSARNRIRPTSLSEEEPADTADTANTETAGRGASASTEPNRNATVEDGEEEDERPDTTPGVGGGYEFVFDTQATQPARSTGTAQIDGALGQHGSRDQGQKAESGLLGRLKSLFGSSSTQAGNQTANRANGSGTAASPAQPTMTGVPAPPTAQQPSKPGLFASLFPQSGPDSNSSGSTPLNRDRMDGTFHALIRDQAQHYGLENRPEDLIGAQIAAGMKSLRSMQNSPGYTSPFAYTTQSPFARSPSPYSSFGAPGAGFGAGAGRGGDLASILPPSGFSPPAPSFGTTGVPGQPQYTYSPQTQPQTQPQTASPFSSVNGGNGMSPEVLELLRRRQAAAAAATAAAQEEEDEVEAIGPFARSPFTSPYASQQGGGGIPSEVLEMLRRRQAAAAAANSSVPQSQYTSPFTSPSQGGNGLSPEVLEMLRRRQAAAANGAVPQSATGSAGTITPELLERLRAQRAAAAAATAAGTQTPGAGTAGTVGAANLASLLNRIRSQSQGGAGASSSPGYGQPGPGLGGGIRGFPFRAV